MGLLLLVVTYEREEKRQCGFHCLLLLAVYWALFSIILPSLHSSLTICNVLLILLIISYTLSSFVSRRYFIVLQSLYAGLFIR